MRTAAVAVVCLVFAFARPAIADTIVMKDGERIEGRVIAVVGDQSYVTLNTGKNRVVPSADIVEILKAAEGEIATAAPLATLEESVAQTLAAFAREGEQSGVIVRASGEKFYVNLGAADGVLPGDRLEVVSAVDVDATSRDRRATGILQVASVQDRLSVCKRISGSAEGGAVKRLAASRKVCPGEMTVEPGADVDNAALVSAVATALGDAPGLQRVDPPAADCRIDVRAAAATGGFTLLVQMVDVRSERVLIENKGFHRTSFTAEDLAFPTVVCASLDTRLDIGPVRMVIENNFGKAYIAGSAVFAPKVSSEGEAAWVFADGRLAIASRSHLSERRNLLKICKVWADVARAVGNVTASMPSEGLDILLWKTAEFHTQYADQFQYVCVENLPVNFSDWVLYWPDSRQSWGLFLREAGPYYEEPVFTLDSAIQPHRYPGISATDIATLPFGRHLLNGSNLSDGWMTIEAFFPEPNGRMSLGDKSGEGMATRTVFSRATSEFFVPVCEAYAANQ